MFTSEDFAKINFRTASSDDAHLLARFHLSSWRESYRGVIGKVTLDSLKEEQWERGWSALVSRANSKIIIYESNGSMNGFARVEVDSEKKIATLTHLYISNEMKRKGVGRQLLAKVLDWVRGRGCVEIYLNVLERNTEARSFYEANGFRESDRRNFDNRFGGHWTIEYTIRI